MCATAVGLPSLPEGSCLLAARRGGAHPPLRMARPGVRLVGGRRLARRRMADRAVGDRRPGGRRGARRAVVADGCVATTAVRRAAPRACRPGLVCAQCSGDALVTRHSGDYRTEHGRRVGCGGWLCAEKPRGEARAIHSRRGAPRAERASRWAAGARMAGHYDRRRGRDTRPLCTRRCRARRVWAGAACRVAALPARRRADRTAPTSRAPLPLAHV